MLAPPAELSDATLVAALLENWGLTTASIEYRPVGWGSHHWMAREANGTRWFVTVDDLAPKGPGTAASNDAAFTRLRAALTTAGALPELGLCFVVAPAPTVAQESVIRLSARFALALYRYVEGESYSWGTPQPPSRRRDLFDLIVRLHALPQGPALQANEENYAVPQRQILESAFEPSVGGWDRGPFARRTQAILADNTSAIRNLLDRFDGLVTDRWDRPAPMVLTHGEPHAGNTMLTPAGLVLIDWETVLWAPPERDLWILESDSETLRSDYAAATGRTPNPSLLDLYRIRWDLADLTAYTSRFFAPHHGSEDDDESWEQLRALIARLRRNQAHGTSTVA